MNGQIESLWANFIGTYTYTHKLAYNLKLMEDPLDWVGLTII